MMGTAGCPFDEVLVKAVDRVAKQLKTSRSAFARKALRDALAHTVTNKWSASTGKGTYGTRWPAMSFQCVKRNKPGEFRGIIRIFLFHVPLGSFCGSPFHDHQPVHALHSGRAIDMFDGLAYTFA
jgi:hypothetical protein